MLRKNSISPWIIDSYRLLLNPIISFATLWIMDIKSEKNLLTNINKSYHSIQTTSHRLTKKIFMKMQYIYSNSFKERYILE